MQITVEGVEITLTEEQKQKICEGTTKYPIFKRNVNSGLIVKFTGLGTGKVVWKGDQSMFIGFKSNGFFPHTNKTWEDVAYDEERDLFDGQPVYCWNNEDTHSRNIRFYDVLYKTVYNYKGYRRGPVFGNYEAVRQEHYTPWMLEAFETLKRT